MQNEKDGEGEDKMLYISGRDEEPESDEIERQEQWSSEVRTVRTSEGRGFCQKD